MQPEKTGGTTSDGNKESSAFSPPSLSLPKGGGAIRGIGEKFAANPVTGTGSMTVPIATSPGRSGFGPQLSLSYDSGAGNGPFGLGWHLSIPSITRKTDKGLPRYLDSEDSDVFILSGAEDLVPLLRDDTGKWIQDKLTRNRTVAGIRVTYLVERYRPRIEGLFARIERWTNASDPTDTFWRSISKDNVTTWYGRTAESRIQDPANPAHIFSWLICESHDAKGNVISYVYKPEDSNGLDLAQANESNRTDYTLIKPPDKARSDRTANRYLKRIRYSSHVPYLPQLVEGQDWPIPPGDGEYYFEAVFDYGDHDPDVPQPTEDRTWPARSDPFSSYRSGFEVRTYRLCQRVLMFHHFPEEIDVGQDCVVRSTDFTYGTVNEPSDNKNSIYSFLSSVTQTGWRPQSTGYSQKSLPALEFTYSEAKIDPRVQTVLPEYLENLPIGLDGSSYQWVDLDGEGLCGVLSEQAGAWFYKRNLSALPLPENDVNAQVLARFAPLEVVSPKPTLSLAVGQSQFMDLAGDGHPDVVQMSGPVRGFFKRTEDADWDPFCAFKSWPNVDPHDPNLRFVDLDGDGHADILITNDNVFQWHPSLAEDGFGPPEFVPRPFDEEKGPSLVFDDGTQSIYLADLSGDGLSDLVRIRNGEVCYWPNLGYGRFGPKVTMDQSPWFEAPDLFDQRRIRLADIDGSGTTDILYLHSKGVRIYFNQSGNSWSDAQELTAFPAVDNLASVQALDLLGNGTACLVWSSPLPGNSGRQMRYIDLMGGQKPHLLVRTVNNLGAETRVDYAPSTKFYLMDRLHGNGWVTKLPFPVHVVERVVTYDTISRNRFATRYAYHHGYFDGPEREFRGFGCVEQWDTELLGAIEGGDMPPDTNNDAASDVPAVRTVTWFHTGAYIDGEKISRYFDHEYYREPGLSESDADKFLLDDTILPTVALLPDGTRTALALSADELREAARALKGSILRQEVYAEDNSAKAAQPYSVSERNYTIECFQPRGADNRYAVFFAHARETIDYHYERDPTDPRISHSLTLDTDEFGNVLKSAAIGYGRRQQVVVLDAQGNPVVDAQGNATYEPNPDLNQLNADDQARQTTTLVTYSESTFTAPIDDPDDPDDYRAPLPSEASTFELTGYTPTGNVGRYQITDFVQFNPDGTCTAIFDQELDYADTPTGSNARRLVQSVRTLYRPDDLGVSANDANALLPFGTAGARGLPGETYKLAFTATLLTNVFKRSQPGLPDEDLLPDPASNVMADTGPCGGGYVNLDFDLNLKGCWWVPSGRIFYSAESPDYPKNSTDDAPTEFANAQQHFFLPCRFRDPFGITTVVRYDGPVPGTSSTTYDLAVAQTNDPVGNQVQALYDYRTLQPKLVTDPNGNQTAAVFDILGMVTATAVMGKSGENQGDELTGFTVDLLQSDIDGFLSAADPHSLAPALLGNASTRIIYDLDCFKNSQNSAPNDPTQWQPVFAATLARETHYHDSVPPDGLKIQISFSYSDGYGREIQKKIQAEPGNVDVVNSDGTITTVDTTPSLRWVSSGWTIFNNKGKPVRQYEPFFSVDQRFQFGNQVGVSPVLFYDPVDRVIATLHPNGTYEKVIFDPWRQETWDANDTVKLLPQDDPDIQGYVANYITALPGGWQSWYDEQEVSPAGSAERDAGDKAAAHANTPTVAHFDTLGRPFMTVVDNGVDSNNTRQLYPTRVLLDIEGNQREVRDAIVQASDEQGRVVMQYDYDMLKNRIHQASMEAGERWMLNDVTGKPIHAWNSRGYALRTEYDLLRRPIRSFVQGGDPNDSQSEYFEPGILFERVVYGEQYAQPQELNLRGKPLLHFDGAGVVTSLGTNSSTGNLEAFDFKGNPLRSSRQLVKVDPATGNAAYKATFDWQSIDQYIPPGATATLDMTDIEGTLSTILEDETFNSSTTFDALNRPTSVTTPDKSVYQPTYNEANLLNTVDVYLQGATNSTSFVTNIDYNAKGQRVLVAYGNDAYTSYDYDLETFRLTNLKTTRPSGKNGPSSAIFAVPAIVQSLNYTYDPVGNITQITDNALASVSHNKQAVSPTCDYTYDPLYRLIKAIGREHIGQSAFPVNPPDNYRDYPFVGWAHQNDLQSLRNYTETYAYDPVGNFETLAHKANGSGWTRTYDYEAPSLIEDSSGTTLSKTSNRLTSSTIASTNPLPETYTYDAHGNMTSMPHLPFMQWDFKDQLKATQQQVVTGADATGERTYYVYDSAGQRVRKVTETAAGVKKNERIYLGGYEIYREYTGTDLTLERDTLHVMDDKQRIALVEATLPNPSGAPPGTVIRYQLSNHLGSASLELDDQAGLISYEEYTPYGTTLFQAYTSDEVSLKRYRYTGKERDDETGFNYHGARYLAVWLGRWVSCDRIFVEFQSALYTFISCNPVTHYDVQGFVDPVAVSTQLRTQSTGSASAAAAVTPPVQASARMSGLESLRLATMPVLDREVASKMLSGDQATLTQGKPSDNRPAPDLSDKTLTTILDTGAPFSPHQNRILYSTIQGPVLGTAMPAVATAAAVLSNASGIDALAHGDYETAKQRFLFALGFAMSASGGVRFQAIRSAYKEAGILQDDLLAAVVGDKGYLNQQITISTGVGITADGTPTIMVSTNAGAGAQLTNQVRALAEARGAIFVEGTGHAEANIFQYARDNGLFNVVADASIPHCGPCMAAAESVGARTLNVSRGMYWYRGQKYGVANVPTASENSPITPSATEYLSRDPNVPSMFSQ